MCISLLILNLLPQPSEELVLFTPDAVQWVLEFFRNKEAPILWYSAC